MRTLIRGLAAALMLSLGPLVLAAQEPGPPGPPPRDSLEARVRERMAAAIQRQVGLNDDQMRRLTATTRKYEAQHRDLFVRERRARTGLREELELGDTTRQAQVQRLLDEMLQVQRQRFDLIEAEQKELATFMTPHQRARYFGMQEQIRRRVDEMRQQQGGARPGNPPAGARRPGGVMGPGGRRPPADAPTRAPDRAPTAGSVRRPN